MANAKSRKVLGGEGERILDFISETFTPEKWAGWLRAPLELAAAVGDGGLAQKLVKAGAEIGLAVHKAVEGGHKDIVNSLLLENGASIRATDENGRTPLHVAARFGEPEIARSLLFQGAYIEDKDKKRCTPLYLSSEYGRVAVTEVLLAAGADTTHRLPNRHYSALDLAAERGRVETVKLLIKHGVNVNEADCEGGTALHCAAGANKVGVIDVLMEAGAQIDSRHHFTGRTALHVAAKWSGGAAVASLLAHGADVNVRDSRQQTPLHRAIANGGPRGTAQVVDLLLRWGADETVVDRDGCTAADVLNDEILQGVRGQYNLPGDVHRVYGLLANAPADRAWRRRGILVLCRAHPDRVWLGKEITLSRDRRMSRRTRCRVKQLATTKTSCSSGSRGEEVEGIIEEESIGGDGADVAIRVVRLYDDDIFRAIVKYL